MHDQMMTASNPGNIAILELIPHRQPFVVIDRLINAGENSVTSYFHIPGEHLFVREGRFQECGIIENIAQTAAAMNGYKAFLEGCQRTMGFIGGIKDLTIHCLPEAGTDLTTMVTEEHHVMNTMLVSGWVSEGERLIATCEMKVFLLDL
jgi:predicted hotdog family 3-hydroxylacyl-ACP dehydratase